MTDWLLALLPTQGLWVLAVATFLSCLAVPMPSSLLLLAAGGFAATGDIGLWQAMAAALAGAVAGDQAGYLVARSGGPALLARLADRPARRRLLDRARGLMLRRGIAAVFLSRWLVSPAGPWVNFAAGAARYPWRRFTASGIAGEAVWVLGYTGLGRVFVGNLAAAEDLIGSALGMVAGVAAMVAAALWLKGVLGEDHA